MHIHSFLTGFLNYTIHLTL